MGRSARRCLGVPGAPLSERMRPSARVRAPCGARFSACFVGRDSLGTCWGPALIFVPNSPNIGPTVAFAQICLDAGQIWANSDVDVGPVCYDFGHSRAVCLPSARQLAPLPCWVAAPTVRSSSDRWGMRPSCADGRCSVGQWCCFAIATHYCCGSAAWKWDRPATTFRLGAWRRFPRDGRLLRLLRPHGRSFRRPRDRDAGAPITIRHLGRACACARKRFHTHPRVVRQQVAWGRFVLRTVGPLVSGHRLGEAQQ